MCSIPILTSAQPFPKQPIPWREEYNISLKGFEFNHPMTVINREELEIVKERIAGNVEPQKSAFNKLLNEAEVQINFIPDAPVTMNIMGGYEPNSNLTEIREWLWRNCHAAYTCALAYAMTDDDRFAEKAKIVLMNWANTGTTFTGNDRGLQLGSWFSPMLYAADLIHNYSGWSGLERTVFHMWWKQNCLQNGDVLDVMRRKDNNWKDAGLLGVMSAAIVLEDSTLLKESIVQLKSYFFTRTDGYVDLPGPGWKIKKNDYGAYLPREVVRNDGSSGLTYTAYALTTMVQCFEIARYAGFNFWHMMTEEGVTIGDVINQYFSWDFKGESFPWHSNPKKTDKRRNCYELANTLLDVDPELHMWVENNWPQINGREGDEYCSLNKGDLMGTGLVPPETPSELTAIAASDKQINLTWTDNSNNEEGFLLQRKSFSSSWFSLGKVDSNITSFSDKLFLSANTAYTYRVQAYMGLVKSEYSNEVSATTFETGTGNIERQNTGGNDLPVRIFLAQNYPNPFNLTTTIEFSTSDEKQRVSLIVYDLFGNTVKTLIDGEHFAGNYKVNWDGHDFNDTYVASGLYWYRLMVGSAHSTNCMLLLK